MNAKPEQMPIQSGSNVDAAEKNNLIAPSESAGELTEVTNDELGQVEGGTVVRGGVVDSIGTRTSPFNSIFRR